MPEPIRIGSLFSGYMGLDMAVEHAIGEVFGLPSRTAWACDIEPGPGRFIEHRFDGLTNFGDITRVDWQEVAREQPVEVLTGGSPCQDISTSGRMLGMTEGTRSNLWVQMRNAIGELRPRLVVWENVRGAMSTRATSRSDGDAVGQGPGPVGDQRRLRALGRVLGDLAELGYDALWQGVRASDVGAPHQRWRVFLLAIDAQAVRHPDLEPRDERWGAAPGQAAGRGPRADTGGPGPSRIGAPADPGGLLLGKLPGGSPAQEAGAHPGHRPGNTGDQRPVGNRWLPRFPWGRPEVVANPFGIPGFRWEQEQVWFEEARTLARGYRARVGWGPYTAAVRRWEDTIGRPAPEPTVTSRLGNPNLSARFVEWMMGLHDGWVTDVPGIPYAKQLRMLGNGVVPQQASAALQGMMRQEHDTLSALLTLGATVPAAVSLVP